MEISRDKVMPLGMRDKEFGGEGRKHRKLSRISKEAGHRLPLLLPINMYSIAYLQEGGTSFKIWYIFTFAG